jgi:hypothetical protein
MGFAPLVFRLGWSALSIPNLGMSNLSAEVRDPRESPAGDQADHQIERHQSPRKRPPFPATREDKEGHGSRNPGGHEPKHSRLLVTLEKWLSRSEGPLYRLFRALSSQIRGTRCEAGERQDAQRDLLYDSISTEQPKPEQQGSECDAEDGPMRHDQMEMSFVHGPSTSADASSLISPH